jgi:FAD/FMN-containing dehydrogenase
MSEAGKAARRHPDLKRLSLYARGDLGLLTRWSMHLHVRRCADCAVQVRRFREAAAAFKLLQESEAAKKLDSITDWSRLEREMAGNIAVGVAAARCIEKAGRRRVLLTPAGALGLALVVLFVAGWLTHVPMAQDRRLAASIGQMFAGRNEAPAAPQPVIETLPQGISLHTHAGTLTILHPPSAIVSLSGPSAVGASYVDQQTGEVTIATVYGQ